MTLRMERLAGMTMSGGFQLLLLSASVFSAQPLMSSL
jgi:hypothetical protein